jgi:hypothetical protein
MAKKDPQEIVNQYAAFEVSRRLKVEQRRERRLILFAAVTAFYITVVIFLFSQGNIGLIFPTSSRVFTTQLGNLSVKQAALDQRVKAIEKNVANTTGTVTLNTLTARVNNVDADVQNIKETILDDPDKAITARLLREKQDEVNRNLADMKANVNQLAGQIDKIFWTIIIVPLLGLMGYVFREIWRKFHG